MDNDSLQPLPVGLQYFEDLIQGGYLYVDKTYDIYNLLKNSKGVYFLSRPRRFGKSLLLSTIRAIFEAKRELFKSLYIDKSNYQWEKHPVIHLSLTEVDSGSLESFTITLQDILGKIAENYDLKINLKLPVGRIFSNLITELHNKYQKKVVVLIDEYDKPLINNITNKDLANQFREKLKSFYTILKDNDPHIRFLLLTGVSKFSKVSIFSGLNNLSDISMSDDYAAVCGYTQEEMEKYFQPYFAKLSKTLPAGYDLLESVKNWYNGYRFSNKNLKVYNPFSTLHLFNNGEFRNYWFASGTPTFLINLIKEKNFYYFDKLLDEELPASAFDAYEIDDLKILPLLVQTGYLTIQEVKKRALQSKYILGFPNKEVRYSFFDSLLGSIAENKKEFSRYLGKIYDALEAKDLERFFIILKSYLANFPYNVQIPAEKYYQSILFAIFSMIYDEVSMEEASHLGRSDLVINLNNLTYVIEIKINKKAEQAMRQIKEKKYYEKYLDSGKRTIIILGINFSTKERNVDDWMSEILS